MRSDSRTTLKLQIKPYLRSDGGDRGHDQAFYFCADISHYERIGGHFGHFDVLLNIHIENHLFDFKPRKPSTFCDGKLQTRQASCWKRLAHLFVTSSSHSQSYHRRSSREDGKEAREVYDTATFLVSSSLHETAARRVITHPRHYLWKRNLSLNLSPLHTNRSSTFLLVYMVAHNRFPLH